LDARLTTLLCKKVIVTKSEEVKTGPNLAESSDECGSDKGHAVIHIFHTQSQIPSTASLPWAVELACN
jgi:hypothetical protein